MAKNYVTLVEKYGTIKKNYSTLEKLQNYTENYGFNMEKTWYYGKKTKVIQ